MVVGSFVVMIPLVGLATDGSLATDQEHASDQPPPVRQVQPRVVHEEEEDWPSRRGIVSFDSANFESADDAQAEPSAEFDSSGDSSVSPGGQSEDSRKEEKAQLSVRLESGYSALSIEGDNFRGSTLFGGEVLRKKKGFETGLYVHHNASPDGYHGPPLINYGLVSRVRVAKHFAVGAYSDLIVPLVAAAVCGEAAECDFSEIFSGAERLPFTVGLSLEAPIDVGRVSMRPLVRTRHYFAPVPFAFPGTTGVTSFEAGFAIQF